MSFNINYLFQGHFDGFENICHTIAYVNDYGVVWGRQFLGPLFFWFPRTLWESKPTGTGEYLAWEYLSGKFDVTWGNISSPLVVEAYINFHLIGISLVFLGLGWICGYWDGRFRRNSDAFSRVSAPDWRTPGRNIPLAIFYPVSLGLFLFTLRGDLLTATSFFVGNATSFTIAYFFVRRRTRAVLN